jgi:hypothetical protein
VQAGGDERQIDYLETARTMMGIADAPLYSSGEVQQIRDRMEQIRARIKARGEEISRLVAEEQGATAAQQ